MTSFNNEVTSEEAVISNVLKRIAVLNKVSYELNNSERVNGKMLSGKQFINFEVNTHRCHIYMISPNKGGELVFVKGENNNKAYYKPNSFPYVSVSLDPLGPVMRKNNHHTIFELGFRPIANIITAATNKTKYNVKRVEDVIWNQMSCYHLVIEANNKSEINYKVKKSETIRSIANDLKINEYRIVELNSNLNNFDSKLIENQFIKVPESYADRIDLYINKANFLPVFQQFKDKNGLFEQYEYKNIKINPEFNPNEFDFFK